MSKVLDSLASAEHSGADKPEFRETTSQALENGARTTLDSCAGRTFSDEEWIQARAKLIQYTAVLRDWEKASPGVGNLEVLCQREP